VKEQLVYEIGDPGHYLSPDVTASFLSLQVEDLGHDRVRVSGARGQPPPPTLKVSATYRDGYRAAGTLTIFGRDAVAKGRRCGEIVLQRLREAGHVLRDSVVECLSTGACVEGLLADPVAASRLETVLRIAVEAESRAAVEQFTRELMPLITAGPPGTTGYAEGRPRVQPVFRYWPCLIDRSRVVPRMELMQTQGVASRESRVGSQEPTLNAQPSTLNPQRSSGHPPMAIRHPPSAPTLRDIAYARSGDKGAHANIGVLARRTEDYAFLRIWLTADRVAAYFQPLGVESVDRYELPNLDGFNFILRGVLRNSLRTDAQGKVLGQALLELPVPDASLC
jgi:Acyclic terpene utilisation family protein AtuA